MNGVRVLSMVRCFRMIHFCKQIFRNGLSLEPFGSLRWARWTTDSIHWNKTASEKVIYRWHKLHLGLYYLRRFVRLPDIYNTVRYNLLGPSNCFIENSKIKDKNTFAQPCGNKAFSQTHLPTYQAWSVLVKLHIFTAKNQCYVYCKWRAVNINQSVWLIKFILTLG